MNCAANYRVDAEQSLIFIAQKHAAKCIEYASNIKCNEKPLPNNRQQTRIARNHFHFAQKVKLVFNGLGDFLPLVVIFNRAKAHSLTITTITTDIQIQIYRVG